MDNTTPSIRPASRRLPPRTVPPGRRGGGSRGWLPAAGLIVLSLVPILAGAMRLTELAGSGPITPDNARFFAVPAPVVVHIISASFYCVFGALQFVPSLRRGRPGWHRIAGRMLVPAGLLAALSGLWMTLFYPHPEGDGLVLPALRLIFGSAMFASIMLGLRSILRRDVVRHSAWMTRGYALGVAAGTQSVILLPWTLLIGPTGDTVGPALMGAGWVINLAVAEYVIRRRVTRPASRPAAHPSRKRR